ncbi:MAG TPA: 16S rRNA (guanine(527)-N(7))-methyltransferase RsmG [Anaerolineaceae bacterium]|nr:16S rRNA (guanine(527)-N(7))-methyltransferase RsmG [Anaerolineaceae bacterium]
MVTWQKAAEELFGIELSPWQLEQFEKYLYTLIEWNAKFNLTAIREPEEIRLKHFLDSLSVTKGWSRTAPPASLVDLGTGAGFPGIPLKIIWPELKLTLVDSVGKKINFCKLVLDTLQLHNADATTIRAEELGQDPEQREKYQMVTARAVAPLPVLLEYCLPLAQMGGRIVLQKGSDAIEEAERCQPIMHKLGGDLKEVLPIELPGVEGIRYLVLIDKNRHTPAIYPRHTGVPSKTPLTV